jgi:hypothetical protein
MSAPHTPASVPETARRITGLFRNQFLNREGLISRNYPTSSRTLFDNFDDIAPFLLHFGHEDFLLDQVHRLTPGSFEALLPTGGILYAYKIDEYLGGLNAIYNTTGVPQARDLLSDAIEKCRGYFLDESGNFSETYDLRRRERSPFFAPWSAGLLETFLELDYLDPELPDLVSRILRSWIVHPFFSEYGLFPFRGTFSPTLNRWDAFPGILGHWCAEPPSRGDSGSGWRATLRRHPTVFVTRTLWNRYLRSGRWVQLMKSNTTPVFTMIELYRRTHATVWADAVDRWIEAALERLIDSSGRPLNAWYPPNGCGVPTLVAGFILIDVLCDAFAIIGRHRRWLDAAERIAEACLKWAWPNGLLPMHPGGDRDHLDGQVDFAISLRRVGELKQRNDLRVRSFKLMDDTLCLHQTQEGFCTHIDREGRPITLPFNTIDPKYNGLLLKGLIHLSEPDRRIYENPDLMDLFKDR